MLLLPSLVILMLFTFYPIYKTLILSFHHSDLAVRKPIFIGLDNYKALASDSIFWKVMSNNIWFAIGTVPTSIALALFMAVMANKAIRGKGFLRTAFFYPNVIPMIAIANVWLFIYTPQYGLLSRLLNYVEQGGLNWLGSQQLVMWALIIMIVWREAGYFMIFYLAGLQNVSRDLYEAADVDGAKPWLVFRKITMPLLMPTTLFVMIIAMTNSFKLVDHLFIMTKGGPDNASSLLLYYIYEQAFAFWDLGKASTLTIVMIAVLLLISAVQFFGLDKKIHYE
ncbi:carbohydrate ABC transporter permease [Paenibacillus sp. Root444D2]|uniref:carbohydrate ABC transporter permease n=1 Tax=Paenibacillus sp. Root444D2 TaxID=1736538 RepID=UPI00070ACE83|nr:sugar ABC transporter permease [Paenibacillus sp. Root444D2]KQX46068.1 ABC transporter permease [Paenibacillus sp. Root444D2]